MSAMWAANKSGEAERTGQKKAEKVATSGEKRQREDIKGLADGSNVKVEW